MRILIIGIVISMLTIGAAPIHNFHISRTEMAYKADLQEIQITVHLFSDDLERGLKRQGHRRLRLGSGKEVATADSLINAYLAKKLQITLDQEQRPFTYVGKELADDLHAFWVYLLIEDVAPFTELGVENTIFTEVFHEQQNTVLFRRETGEDHEFLFNNVYTADTFVLE